MARLIISLAIKEYNVRVQRITESVPGKKKKKSLNER